MTTLLDLLLSFVSIPGLASLVLTGGAGLAWRLGLQKLVLPLVLGSAALAAVGYVGHLHKSLRKAEAAATAAILRAERGEQLARDNAAAAEELQGKLEHQASEFTAHLSESADDRTHYQAARRAMLDALRKCAPDGVHQALAGEASPESAPLAPSLQAALEALRKGKRK